MSKVQSTVFLALQTNDDTRPIIEAIEIDNPLAYRETDRHVYRAFGKKPLSGSFDKLGNNATVAMVYTRRLSATGQLRVMPFDEPLIGIPTAIEVYPALLKSKVQAAMAPVLGVSVKVPPSATCPPVALTPSRPKE